MITLHTFKRILWCASLFIIFSTDAATRFVTSLLDDGSPGTLRTTIALANAGDTILFNVSGTIFLESVNGELTVDKKLAINGEKKIVIDGQNLIDTCLHILDDAVGSCVEALTIQHFSDGNGTEATDVHGILIDAGASNCTIKNCIIQKLSSNSLISSTVFGIRSLAGMDLLTDNVVSALTRGNDAAYEGGFVVGIDARVIGSFSNNSVSDCSTGASNSISGATQGIQAFVIGQFSNNKVARCSTGAADGVSGPIAGISVDIIEGDCIGNIVSECATGAAGEFSGSVLAIRMSAATGNCLNNTVMHCLTGMSNDLSGGTTGIRSSIVEGNCSNNTVTHCLTGMAHNQSGVLNGIIADILAGDCFGNTVAHHLTGTATVSGVIVGLNYRSTNGNCYENTIHDLSSGIASTSGLLVGMLVQLGASGSASSGLYVVKNKIKVISAGEALSRGYAQGLRVAFDIDNSHVSCNTIKGISGGEGLEISLGNTVGLKISQGNRLVVQGNTISEVAGENGKFTTGMQLGDIRDSGLEVSVSNSDVSWNRISDVSDNTSGFGITILTEESNGNSILSNSIFDTTGKAINVLDNFFDGENISSFTDAIVTLASVNCTNRGKIRVTGTVDPQMGLDGQPFLLQFFASDTNPPAQAKTLLFEYLLTGSENNSFDLTFTPAVSTSFGQYISATATAQVQAPVHNWNTSEVSNALPTCNSAGAPYTPFICPDVPTPIKPFDCNACPFMQTNGNVSDIL